MLNNNKNVIAIPRLSHIWRKGVLPNMGEQQVFTFLLIRCRIWTGIFLIIKAE